MVAINLSIYIIITCMAVNSMNPIIAQLRDTFCSHNLSHTCTVKASDYTEHTFLMRKILSTKLALAIKNSVS